MKQAILNAKALLSDEEEVEVVHFEEASLQSRVFRESANVR